MQTRTKESRKRLQSLILLTAFTCVLLIVSTYAWFTTQKDVNVSNIRAKVEVAEGLSISLDGAEWTQTLDLGNALDSGDAKYQPANASLTDSATTLEYGPYDGHRNHVPDEFLPVSTSGDVIDIGASAGGLANRRAGKELGFYTGKYDGNTTQDFEQIIKTDEDTTTLTPSDSAYAGYYAFDMFLKNTSKTGVTKDILQLNSDAYAWVLPEGEKITNALNIDYVGDPNPGIQNAIRVAFARYGDGESAPGKTFVDVKDVTNDPLTQVVQATAGYDITKVAIWEPNHDDHKNRIIANIGKLFPTGTNPLPVLTPGQTDYDRATYVPFWVCTLKSTAVGQTIDNVFDWSNTHMKKTPTLQTTTTYGTETGKLNGFTVEGVQNLITTDSTATSPTATGDSNYEVMTLAANSITRFRVYIYIEGQDPDCDTDASAGGGIEVSVALTKGEAQGSMDRYNELYTAEGSADDRASYTGGSVTGTANPGTVAGS